MQETSSVDGSHPKRFSTSLLPLGVPKGEKSKRVSSTESLVKMQTLWTSSIREVAPDAVACRPCNGSRA